MPDSVILRTNVPVVGQDTWFVTLHCPEHGLVDVEIPWEQAKTPVSAKGKAVEAHQVCFTAREASRRRAHAQEQIDQAERNRAYFAQRLVDEEQTLAAVEAEAVPADPQAAQNREQRLGAAQAAVAKQRWNVEECQQHLANVTAANGPIARGEA